MFEPRVPILAAAAAAVLLSVPLAGQERAASRAEECPSCAGWNEPVRPFRLFGDSYYVGTRGLGAVLIASAEGHILLDGALPESAPLIETSIRELGFRPEDVRLIVNSHAHFDHAGGIAALQRLSGAAVAASPAGAAVLRRGSAGPDDPQYGAVLDYPAVPEVREVADGETLRVGPLAVTARSTPGHTPGGTSWSWRSCEDGRCLDLVYADSQTPVSADGFSFTRSATYPAVLADFERGLSLLERLPCDVLVTTHPTASGLWERLAAREAGDADALRNPEACRRYAAAARRQVERRVAEEKGKG